MKKITLFLAALIFTQNHSVLAYKSDTPRNSESGGTKIQKKIYSEAGLNIPQWGIAIDAVYDRRLDNLVPGYKIINVVLSNRGAASIFLDPKKDKWQITDNIGKSIDAITHLRFVNEKLWLSLPSGLRDKLEYPQTLRVGNSTKIDLFFPASHSIENFREISWSSFHFKKEFNIVTASEKNDNDKGEPLPNTPTYKRSIQKYDEHDPLLKKQEEPSVHDQIKNDAPSDTPPADLRSIPAL